MNTQLEQLSNNFNDLRRRAEKEVEDIQLNAGDTVLVYFSKFPSIAGFPFRIALIQTIEGELRHKVRTWDTAYDMKRWKNGIYNLGRLRIICEEKSLSAQNSAKIENILDEIAIKELPKNLHNSQGILLDSSEWKLGISTTNLNAEYSWRAANRHIEIFEPLIESLLQLKNQ